MALIGHDDQVDTGLKESEESGVKRGEKRMDQPGTYRQEEGEEKEKIPAQHLGCVWGMCSN